MVRRATFVFIFITVVLDMLALGVIVPVFPRLIVEFNGGDRATAASIYGVFGSVFALMQFLFSPVLGSLSDRFGRRPVILISCLGLGLDYLFMAMAPSLGWLFVGRIISGITSSAYSTATAFIADVTPREQRAAKFGMLGVAFGIGFIIGPSLGGLLGSVNLRAPFYGAAVLSLLNAAYGYFVLPESLPADKRSPFQWKAANPAGSLRMLRSHPLLIALAAAGFLSMLAHDAAPSTFVLYTTYRYGWSEATVGLVLALVGVTSMIVQGALVGRMVSALGERRALAFGYLSGAVGNLLFGLAPFGAMFIWAIPVNAFFGLASPALQSLMTSRVDASEQGRLQGAQGSLTGIASMTAPLLFTQAFSLAIGPYRGWNVPGIPFLMASALLIGAMTIALRAVSHVPPAPAIK